MLTVLAMPLPAIKREFRMCNDITSAVWKLPLPTRDKMVLLCLGHRAGAQDECAVSVATLIEETGYSERSIDNALDNLEARGLIKSRREGRNCTTYSLMVIA